MTFENYQGFLLAAHPKRKENLKEGVIFIVEDSAGGSIGLQINKQLTNSVGLRGIMENMGIPLDYDRPLYEGGLSNTNRINLIHSLDWQSLSTKKVTESIGITSDISVLAALSKGQGPEFFRAIVGCVVWEQNSLAEEIQGKSPVSIEETWTYSESNIELVFELEDSMQWHQIINESTKLQIANWL